MTANALPQSSADAERRAHEWAQAWNARDLATILAHFRDDVVFRTPIAAQMLGTPTLHGKAALQAYWEEALRRIGHLHFAAERAIWDPAQRELAVLYVAELDDRRTRAIERLRLDEHGQVAEADALYGAPVP
jgi:ketosteroid isomerase-like protein